MEFREATVDDVEALRGVARRSWARDPALTRETATTSVEEWYDDRHLRAAVEAADEVVLVAAADGEASDGDRDVLGFSHSVVDLPDGTVLRLYVDPDHRRDGVGTALLDRTREALASRGVERVRGFVLTANEPGNAFYRAAGFERVDEGETVIGGERYDEAVYERAAREDDT